MSGFLLAAAFIAVAIGFSLLFPNRLLDRAWRLNPAGAALFRSIGPLSGVFLLGLGAALVPAARGLLRGKKWAWSFAVTLFAIDGAGDIVSYFLIHDALRTLVGVMVSSVFLIVLCRRDFREYCFAPVFKPEKVNIRR
ncbi:MAG TPA: hypothetical protein VH724_20090 [Candidatus Angelobacter sp.]|nr:hypothetical protein [Candidatus Angelobacter sp.]